MVRKSLYIGCLVVGIFFLCFSMANAEVIDTYFSENWEYGQGDWDIDYGVWEVGTPTSGPGDPHGGVQCAGTVLDGKYPDDTDSRLISPSFTLGTISGDEELHLRFWHWFNYYGGDYGYVQISVYDNTTGWSEWEDVSGNINYYSACWSLKSVDISEYAGQRIRIAFHHRADGYGTKPGWYIDDIEVIKIIPEFTGGFEQGWGDWYADNGVWEIGTPTAEPGAAHSGSQCAGTVLDGNYPDDTDSRLISPSFLIPERCGEKDPQLRFWHWFNYYGGDYGYVQISVYDQDTGEWLNWENILGPISGYSAGWTRSITIDLFPYAGKKVRFSFYHRADGYGTEPGWYIDDIKLPGVFPNTCEGDFDNEGDVDGSDLAVFAADFGRTDCSLQNCCNGDFDNDGDVDGSDLALFAADFGRTDCFNPPPED